jgi:hypothetical protein
MAETGEVTPKSSTKLAKELKFYHAKLPEWAEHEGKYALIHGEEIIEFYSSYEDAIKIGYSRFGLEPFLVKQVHVMEQVQFVSRLVEPAVVEV